MIKIEFRNREEWRKWLELNHEKEKEVWVVHYKKKSKIEGLSYSDAVEEAICFGWIDSKMISIDETKYMQRYSPRNKDSIWSELNRKRAEKMIEQGKMTDTGYKRIEEAKVNGNWISTFSSKLNPEIPIDLQRALEKNATLYENFNKLPKSHQLAYLQWLNSAKKETTRKKRIEDLLLRISKT